MTQFVLLTLGDNPRAIGPFRTEQAAATYGLRRGYAEAERLIQPLEAPNVYGYGAHALTPSPKPRQWIEGRPEKVPLGSPWELARRGRAVEHWITGEALELSGGEVLRRTDAIGYWSGKLARFGVPTTDGRVLQLHGEYTSDWLPHLRRVPLGLWLMGEGGPLPLGLCERVRVEDGWLLAEGRISLKHLHLAAPEWTTTVAEPQIPVGIDVTGGNRAYGNQTIISGPWELERVVLGSTPAWPDCSIQIDRMELEPGAKP